MDHKNSKWAKGILDLQNGDGTWGLSFHSLSVPSKRYPLTTEQALRRLSVLGFGIDDAPIAKAVEYMGSCLRGERMMDGYSEKTHDWPLFTKMMLSTWIRVFEPNNKLANEFAQRWARVIENAFAHGEYSHNDYADAYSDEFCSTPKGGREIDFSTFYHTSLLKGMLSPKAESAMLDYLVHHKRGIYYIYSHQIAKPPEVFASLETSRYLAALEILSGYSLGKEKLKFAIRWIQGNKEANGLWDLGATANDGVYFPLSDSWRKAEDRKADCTERILALLGKLGG
ncbi:MAG: hypothetical protein FWG30_05325 [Eubacteriaceae bacterium]|nr:hypothetical protein [Eubacteriaceae bacterium]